MFTNRKKFGTALSAKIFFTLLQKNPEVEQIIVEKLKEDGTDFSSIRCPHCKWQPKASNTWFCSDCDFPEYFYGGCETAWNTFSTHGKCPGCKYQWRWTSCLSCSEWALHADWYVNNG
ncbi:MAG: hypothetical protein M3405_08620 [Acidobacteriota bacterium]|jgi:hypothetical protein|nr:hypothetical protein [Acidobacteriota bacterium]